MNKIDEIKLRLSAGLYLKFNEELNLSLADCDEMVEFIIEVLETELNLKWKKI
jgi:hypothetical protein